MINIEYRINEESIYDCSSNIYEKPIIYGVFVIESDSGLSLRDRCMLDDELFDLLKFNDDLFNWFFSIQLINIKLLSNNNCNMLDYDLDNDQYVNSILFNRIGNKLKIYDIKYEKNFNTSNPIDIISHKGCEIISSSEININDWIVETSEKTEKFIKDLISIKDDLQNFEYVKLLRNNINN